MLEISLKINVENGFFSKGCETTVFSQNKLNDGGSHSHEVKMFFLRENLNSVVNTINEKGK